MSNWWTLELLGRDIVVDTDGKTEMSMLTDQVAD